ncbi:amicyanin [Paracoccus sp. (in: a-proteobacteria)]|uniref:amicyanin n=1 Tax=Paracoccus sp. TaxID=267 RepID=UPI0028973E14|nr:amicyanin [Paracoccus sp. (in: a-proteobacteria)]
MNSAMKTRSLLAALALATFGATAAFAADKVTVPSETPVAEAEAPADAVIVNIDKLKYETPEVKIKVGQTVTWVNKEAMPHNVDFVKGVVGEAELKGPMLKKGFSFSVTFNEAGTFDYHCTPHPFMRGKVIVE